MGAFKVLELLSIKPHYKTLYNSHRSWLSFNKMLLFSFIKNSGSGAAVNEHMKMLKESWHLCKRHVVKLSWDHKSDVGLNLRRIVV
jgi:hypothetical protein